MITPLDKSTLNVFSSLCIQLVLRAISVIYIGQCEGAAAGSCQPVKGLPGEAPVVRLGLILTEKPGGSFTLEVVVRRWEWW